MMKNKTTVLSALMATALLVTLSVSFAASQTDQTATPEVSKEVTEAIEAIKGYRHARRERRRPPECALEHDPELSDDHRRTGEHYELDEFST
jgi:hypothetical protein